MSTEKIQVHLKRRISLKTDFIMYKQKIAFFKLNNSNLIWLKSLFIEQRFSTYCVVIVL